MTAVLREPGPLENTCYGVMGRVQAGTFVTLRAESCERLFRIMSKRGVVFIKAPSCTGKTSQLQLLRRWLDARGLEAVYISFLLLGARDDVVEFIERRAKCSWQVQKQLDPVRRDKLHNTATLTRMLVLLL